MWLTCSAKKVHMTFYEARGPCDGPTVMLARLLVLELLAASLARKAYAIGVYFPDRSYRQLLVSCALAVSAEAMSVALDLLRS